jgi:hypothetical protein
MKNLYHTAAAHGQTTPISRLSIIVFLLLSGSVRAADEPKDQAAYDDLARVIWGEIAPEAKVVRPPYDLARHDLSLETRRRGNLRWKRIGRS